MGVVLLIVVLLTVGCSSDEDLNGPVPVVTAQLNFSLPTRIAGVHHATRMTGDIVQEKPLGGTENDVFRGLDGVQMLCFDEYPTESSYKLGNMIDIKADEAYDSVATEDDYSLCQQIEIPVGTSYFGFYASATEELSTEDKEKYKTQHEKRMHFGAIETVGLSKSSYQGNSNIRFKPLQICTSTDPLGGSDIGKDLLQLLNDLMEIIDPAGNLYLNEAYQRLTEFSTLSSYNVQTMLGFILKLVNQEAPDNQGSQSVSAVTAKITSCCAKDETQQPIFDIDKGTIKLKDEYMGFPADLHLPDGAARIRWNKAQGKFEVPDKQEYGNDLDVTSVNDYVYPMSLQYQVFSDILASDDMVILTTNSEGEVVPPDDPQYKTWDDLIKKGYIDNNADNEVQSTTQSVAMVKQVQYAVGRLALKARLGNDTYLKDANGKSVYVGNNPFTLKGYHTARDGPQRQQVLFGVVCLIVTQNLAHRLCCEWLQLDGTVVAPEQRLPFVLENLLHHAKDAARHNQAHIRPLLVFVPQVLHVAEHPSIYVLELLELVNEQREPPPLANLQQQLQQVAEICDAEGGTAAASA